MTDDPAEHVEQWTALYGALIQRRGITGIRAFSPVSFARQLGAWKIALLRVFHENRVIAAPWLRFVQGEVAYCHLTAGRSLAYTLDAAYALYWSAIEHFRGKLRWLNIGRCGSRRQRE